MQNKQKIKLASFLIMGVISSLTLGIVPYMVLVKLNRQYLLPILILSLILGFVSAWIQLTAEKNYNWNHPNRAMSYGYLIVSLLPFISNLSFLIFNECYSTINLIRSMSEQPGSLLTLILILLLSEPLFIALMIFLIIRFKNSALLINLMFHLFLLGNSPEMLKWCQKILPKQKKSKNRFSVINVMCICYNESGQFEKALNLMQTVSPSELNQHYKAVYYNNLIYNLLMINRTEEAANIFQQNASLFQNNPAMLHTTALLNYMTNHFYDAVRQFRQVLENPPSQATAFICEIDLARTLILLKDFPAAETELNKAEALCLTDYNKWRLSETQQELEEATKNQSPAENAVPENTVQP